MIVWSSVGTRSYAPTVARYESVLNPNVTVHMSQFGEPPMSVFKYWLDALSGPDVIPISSVVGIHDELVTYFHDLSSLVDANFLADLLPSARQSVMASDGTVRGLPMFADVVECFYPLEVFARLGLSIPTTWSEMVGLCPALEAAGLSCFGSAMPSVPATVFLDLLAVRMYGQDFYSQLLAGNVSLTEDVRVQAVLDVVSSVAPHFWTTKDAPDWAFSSPKPGGIDRLYDLGEFAAGRTGMMCEYSSVIALGGLYRILNVSEVGTFRFPDYDLPVVGESGDGKNAEVGWVSSLGVPKNAEFPDAAMELLAHLANPVEQAPTYLYSPLYPLRKSLNNTVTGAIRTKVYANLNQASALLHRSFGMTGVAEVYDPWSDLANAMLVAATEDESRALVAAQVPVIDMLRISAMFSQTVAPVFDPPSGQFGEQVSVTLSSRTPGALIFFTLDGTEPGLSSPVYSNPIPVTLDGTTTVRAVALAEGLSLSSSARADYVLQLPRAASSTSDTNTNTKLVLAIVLPLVFVACVATAMIGYIVYQRKSVTYRLSSDSELLIDKDELVLKRCVGQGSFGKVYEAVWRATPVAVKQMLDTAMGPSQLREFVSEASLLLNLRHRNVLIFMGVTLEPPAIVTEFMERGSLYQVLHNPDIVIDSSMVFKWAHAMASGLHFLQHSGVVHGDFKSLNVLFDASWTAKICDFGLSSVQQQGASKAVISSGQPAAGGKAAANQVAPIVADLEANATMNHNVGTLFWAAPELLTGAGKPNNASDAFALGVTLWEMTTREDLYAGLNPLAVALEVVMGRRPDTSGVAPHFSELVSVMVSLWKSDPKDRLTLREAVDLLATLYSNETLVFPTTVADPCGVVYAVAIVVAGCGVRISVPHKTSNESRKVVEFEKETEGMVRACSGAIVDRGFGRIVAVFHNTRAFESFAEMHLSSQWGFSTASVASKGEIRSTKGEHGERKLTGPVMESLTRVWIDVFGTERFVETGLEPVGPENSTRMASGGTGAMRPRPRVGLFAPGGLVHEVVASSKSLIVEDLDSDSDLDDNDVGGGSGGGMMEDGSGAGAYESSRTDRDGPLLRIAVRDEYCADIGAASSIDFDTSGTIAQVRVYGSGETNQWLVPRSTIAELVQGSTMETLGSYARVYDSEWNGKPVLVKVLIKQDHSVAQLATIAASATRSAHAARVAEPSGIGPIALCLDRPYVALVFPRLMHGSLLSVMAPYLTQLDRGDGPDPQLTMRSGAAAPPNLPLSALLSVLADIARALSTMHAEGIGHGSLKPSNVLLSTGSGLLAVRGVLTDAALDPIKANQGTMTMIPSVAYLSPESLSGHDATPGGDVFVIGTLLFEMATQSRAFGGVNAIEVGTKIMSGVRPDLHDKNIPPRLCSLIEACWATDMTARPSASVVADKLAALAGSLA